MKHLLILLLISSFATNTLRGQDRKQAKPKSNKYSQLLAQLEAGKTDINYQEFRFSFLESDKYAYKQAHQSQLEDLKKDMYAAAKAANYKEVVQKAKAVIQIDYTDMAAHKYLQQSYKYLGDSANCKRYKAIEFGLLKSITSSGDGKSCATAWQVIDIDEEYFVLKMLGAVLTQQSIDNTGGNICDKMDVTEGDKEKTYYFDVSRVFSTYERELK